MLALRFGLASSCSIGCTCPVRVPVAVVSSAWFFTARFWPLAAVLQPPTHYEHRRLRPWRHCYHILRFVHHQSQHIVPNVFGPNAHEVGVVQARVATEQEQAPSIVKLAADLPEVGNSLPKCSKKESKDKIGRNLPYY